MDKYLLFLKFREILLTRTGILIHEDEKWPLLLQNFNVSEIERLLEQKTAQESVWARVYEILNISETYFYRDPKQLNGIFHSILPRHWRKPSQKSFSIWSAGCSKGEEAYTLAILTEIFRITYHLNFQFSVLGTDLQLESVRFAREGNYTPYSIRAGLPDEFRAYLRNRTNHVSVADEIKKHVHFQVGNLLDPPPGKFDLIICRNVLIYLDETSKEKIINNFTQALNEGGILVLGHSEFIGTTPNGLKGFSLPNSTSYFVFSMKEISNSLPQTSQPPKPPTKFSKTTEPPTSLSRKTKSIDEKPLETRIVSTLKVPRSAIESARIEKEKGNFEAMVSSLKKALYENPNEIEAYYELANHYWEAQDRTLARRFQAQARSVFKNAPGLSDTLKKNGSWSDVWDEFLTEDL